MQENVVEAVTNDVWGTRNLVEAAAEHGRTYCVLTATDKAVSPTSIYGRNEVSGSPPETPQ